MDELTGYCGYRCSLCAARSDDPALRQQLVEGWRTYLGHQNYTVDNVRCDGCRANGRIADKECQARPCAIAKALTSCAMCDEFPCEKVKGLIGSSEIFMVHANKRLADIPEETYNLCLRQFESLPVLMEALEKAGKLPAWMAKNGSE